MAPFWKTRDERVTLYTANCLEAMSTLEPDSVDVIWADPPFFLSGGGTTCKAGKRASVNKGPWDAPLTPTEQVIYTRLWLAQARRLLRPTGTVWICGSPHSVYATGYSLLFDQWRILNEITWEKPNPPPNLGCRCFTHSHESIIWASTGRKAKHVFNYGDMRAANGGRQMKDVWRFSAPRVRDRDKHPTEKPVQLVKRCLRASMPPDGVVLDPFAGAGTTGVAAMEDPTWSYIGIELDPKWNEVAKARITEAKRARAA